MPSLPPELFPQILQYIDPGTLYNWWKDTQCSFVKNMLQEQPSIWEKSCSVHRWSDPSTINIPFVVWYELYVSDNCQHCANYKQPTKWECRCIKRVETIHYDYDHTLFGQKPNYTQLQKFENQVAQWAEFRTLNGRLAQRSLIMRQLFCGLGFNTDVGNLVDHWHLALAEPKFVDHIVTLLPEILFEKKDILALILKEHLDHHGRELVDLIQGFCWPHHGQQRPHSIFYFKDLKTQLDTGPYTEPHDPQFCRCGELYSECRFGTKYRDA